MFYNALPRQGSSFCNKARLNFQAFALRGMEMAPGKDWHVGQKMTRRRTRRRIYFHVSEL